MSLSASRKLLSSLLSSRKQSFIKCLVGTRFKTDNVTATINDTKVSNKIETAVLKKFSEPLVIEGVEPPKEIKSSEVIIDVNYCALNGLDVLLCENLYSQKYNLPFVPGYEVCGKLLQVSEEAKKAGFNIGDKVVALNKETLGGFSEQCVTTIDNIWKVPSTIKSIDAVCLLENYMTALIGLEEYGAISETDMVLVNVGIGGIGLAAVDIAANIYKAKVIGVGFSEDRADKIRDRGAFHAFTYKEKKLHKEIEEIAGERDIKNIFEGDDGGRFKKMLNSFMDVYKSKPPSKYLLRDDNFGVVVHHLTSQGRIIIAGVAGTNFSNEGEKPNEDKFTVPNIDLRDYKKRKYDHYRQAGDDVISFFEEGLVKPVPSMIAGFYHVNKAFQFVSEMKACGKVLVDMKNKELEVKIQ